MANTMIDKPIQEVQSASPIDWHETAESEAAPSEADIDLDELAKRIYALLREELRITRERLG